MERGQSDLAVAAPGFDMETCLARARERDEQACRDLLHELYPLVLKLVRAHLPVRTGEEDLCQMIFIKVFQHLDQYSGKAPIHHWVSRIAVNTCMNALAAEKVRPELRWADLDEREAEVLQSLATTTGELDPTQNVASRELVDLMLAKLNPQDRLVVNLLHMEGCSVQEVGQLTGWSLPLVKVRAFRARRKLRKLFSELMKEATP